MRLPEWNIGGWTQLTNDQPRKVEPRPIDGFECPAWLAANGMDVAGQSRTVRWIGREALALCGLSSCAKGMTSAVSAPAVM